MRIGVLALQGAFREHCAALERLGVTAQEVRAPADLEGIDGLIIPGGESTTIDKLLDSSGLREPLIDLLDAGLPAFGTCAGLIMLAQHAVDGTPDQRPLARIAIDAQRNGYGAQVHSFESSVVLEGDDEPMTGVFIRAPRIVRVGDGVEVLARVDGEPVAVASGAIMVCAFHPELANDDRLHRRFVELVSARSSSEG